MDHGTGVWATLNTEHTEHSVTDHYYMAGLLLAETEDAVLEAATRQALEKHSTADGWIWPVIALEKVNPELVKDAFRELFQEHTR